MPIVSSLSATASVMDENCATRDEMARIARPLLSCGIDLISTPARFYPLYIPLCRPASHSAYQARFPFSLSLSLSHSSSSFSRLAKILSDSSYRWGNVFRRFSTLGLMLYPVLRIVSKTAWREVNTRPRSPPLFMFLKCARSRCVDRNKIARRRGKTNIFTSSSPSRGRRKEKERRNEGARLLPDVWTRERFHVRFLLPLQAESTHHRYSNGIQ